MTYTELIIQIQLEKDLAPCLTKAHDSLKEA